MQQNYKTSTPKHRSNQGHHSEFSSSSPVHLLNNNNLPSPTTPSNQRVTTQHNTTSSMRKRQNSQVKREFVEIMEKCKDLKRMYSNKQHQYRELEEKHGMVELELRHQIAINNQQFAKFEQALQSQQEEIEYLKQELTKTNILRGQQISALRSQSMSLVQEKNAILADLQKCRRRCDEIGQSYDALAQERTSLKQQIQAMSSTYYRNSEEYDQKILSKLTLNEKHLMDRLRDVQRTVVGYVRQLESMEAANSKIIADKQNQIRVLTEKFQKYSYISEGELRALKIQLKRQEKQHYEELTRSVRQAEKAAEGRTMVRFQNKVNALGDLKTKNTALHAKIQQLELESASTRILTSNFDASNPLSQLLNQNSRVKEQNSLLTEQNLELLSKIKTLQEQINHTTKDMAELNRQNQQLVQQINMYTEAYKERESADQQIEKALSENFKDISDIKTTLLSAIQSTMLPLEHRAVQTQEATAQSFKLDLKPVIQKQMDKGETSPKSRSELIASLKSLAPIPAFKKPGASPTSSSSVSRSPSPVKEKYLPANVVLEEHEQE